MKHSEHSKSDKMPAMKTGAMPSMAKNMGKGDHKMPSEKEMNSMHKGMKK